MKNFTFIYFYILLAAGLLLLPTQLRAQTYLMPVSGSATFTTCAGTLYDSGGPNAPYPANSSSSVTLLPGTAGSKIKLSFASLDLGLFGSEMRVYDGVGTSAPYLGSFKTDSRPTDLYATTASGALTVELYAYGNSQPGFVATVSCVGTVPPPDFAIPRLMLDKDGVLPGQYVRLDALLGNLSGRASACEYACYLSKDAAFSSDDLLLPTYPTTTGTLAAGISWSLVPAVTIPSSVAEGQYYVLLLADPNNQVSETNEANNQQATPLLVSGPAPDLAFTYNGASTRPGLGGTVTFVGALTNQGVTTAPATRLGFYLSTDDVLSAADVLLGTDAIRSLAAGSTQAFSTTLPLPASATLGPCYLLAVADDLGQLTAEIDRRNNTVAYAAEIVPPTIDLSIKYAPLVLPNQAGAGGLANTICYLQNAGSVAANPSTIGYYLSTDQTLSANDQLMGSTIYGLIDGYDYWRVDGQVTVPAGTPPGHYYLLAVADYLNQLSETDETNNVWAAPFEVVIPSIDLAIFSPYLNTVYAPATPALPGMKLWAGGYLGNLGTTLARNATLACYLSADSVLSAGDQRLGRDSVQVLGSGGQSVSCPVRLPASLAPGTYYLLLVADYRQQQPDFNRSNNVRVIRLPVIAPDLDLAFATAPGPTPALSAASAYPGTQLTVTGALLGTGTTIASPVAMEYYLSTDNALSANDVALGQAELALVQPGRYTSFSYMFTMPAGTAAGSYYLLLAANYHGQLPEANLANNLHALPLTVKPLQPDLTLEQLSLATPSLRGGRLLPVRLYARNLGNAPAPLSAIGYYLSADAVFDGGDVLLLTADNEALEAGQRELRQATLVLPPATAAGSYYVLAVADPAHALPDSNPANNVASAALAVTGPFEWAVVPRSGTASLTSCATRVYASNGLAPYANNSRGSLTIWPGASGSRVRLTFSAFLLEAGADYVQVLDGPSTSSPQLGLFSGHQVPPSVVASPQNASGALTLYFFSDSSVNDQGFEAVVSCEQSLPTQASQSAGYDVQVLPNPVAGGHLLHVRLDGTLPAGPATLTLYNALGQAVASQPLLLAGRATTADVPTAGLAAGVYMLRLSGAGMQLTRRVVVQ